MTIQFSPERSAAIRDQLISSVRGRPARRRKALGATLLLAGALVGAGASTAAFAATGSFAPAEIPVDQPTATLGDAVSAPPGTVPGSPVVSLLGSSEIVQVSGTKDLALEGIPVGATHVRVTLTMLSPGVISWGTDPEGNNQSMSALAADIGSPSADAWYDFPLEDATSKIYFTTSETATATAVVQYVNYVPTRLGVNAEGNTFGVDGGPDGAPDLVRVSGTGANGEQIEGYAWASDIAAFSPDHVAQPSDPEEALLWQAERDEKYPGGWDIPVYDEDGSTVIGTFHVN